MFVSLERSIPCVYNGYERTAYFPHVCKSAFWTYPLHVEKIVNFMFREVILPQDKCHSESVIRRFAS
jgi:hypothetical protein